MYIENTCTEGCLLLIVYFPLLFRVLEGFWKAVTNDIVDFCCVFSYTWIFMFKAVWFVFWTVASFFHGPCFHLPFIKFSDSQHWLHIGATGEAFTKILMPVFLSQEITMWSVLNCGMDNGISLIRIFKNKLIQEFMKRQKFSKVKKALS